MSTSPTETTRSDTDLASLVEEITARIEGGRPVRLADYERRYPEHGEQLRRLMPTLGALGRFGMDDSSPTDTKIEAEGTTARQLGDFRIVREIGRGGMGVVYEARQLSLDRRVALKVLPFAAMLDGRQLARFKTEAQAAACLHHANIVPVHSVGSDRGVHYYAMQYIDGQSLAAAIAALHREQLSGDLSGEMVSAVTRLSQPRSLSAVARGTDGVPQGSVKSTIGSHSATLPKNDYFRVIAKLGIQAADALEHAHQSGVIHRDIKPGNLLLDSNDKLWVTDFGLARVENDSQLTMTGDVIGTLRYMSPEQALSLSGAVDHRTDIYSLGVTLYELLTIRPAYQGGDRHELLTKIALHEPISPRKINRQIPMDLETIVGKAMEKDAGDRYATAQALADDLRCFLEHHTISAKRATLLTRVHKWSRRHPAVVRSAFATLTLIALAAVLSTALVLREKGETERALLSAEANFMQSESNRRRAEEAVDDSEKLLYVRGLGLAARAWHDGDGANAAALMRSNPAFQSRPDLRGFEWHYLQRVSASPHEMVLRGSGEWMATAWSGDGRYAAAGNFAGDIRLWDTAGSRSVVILRGHRGPVHDLSFHPQGSELASCCEDGSVRIWDVAQGKQTRSIEASHDGKPVFAIRYSPDGGRLASGGGDNVARVWDASSLRQQQVLRGHTRAIRALAFAPDGERVATAGNDRVLRLWEVATGRHLKTLKGHKGMVLCVTFSPNGQYLVSGCNDHTLRLWHSDSGEEAAVIRGHRDGVQTVAMLPDGNHVVAGDRGGQLRVWKIRGKRIVDQFDGEELDRFLAVRLSPDGRSWAGLCVDGRLLIRDIATQQTRVVQSDIASHYSLGELDRLAYSPDGSQLYCADRIVDLRSNEPSDVPPAMKLDVPAGAAGHFSPDGRVLATGWNSSVKLWDPHDGSLVGKLDAPFDALAGLRFSPDGKYLAAWFLRGRIVIWQWRMGNVVHTIEHPDAKITDFEYAPDGRRFATCNDQSEVRIWDAKTATSEKLACEDRRVSAISWLHGGAAIALSTPGQTDVVQWLDGSRLVEPIGTNREVVDTHFSQRHRLLLSHDRRLGVVVRNLDQLEIASGVADILQGHTDRVWSVSVSRQGRQIISASRDGSLRRWSLLPDRWQWLTERRHPNDYIDDFAWLDDGATLVLAQMDQCSFRDWCGGHLQSKVTFVEPVGSDPMGFVFESVACGGDLLATGHRDGHVRIWDKSRPGPTLTLVAASLDETVSALRFSPDHRLLACCSRNDNRLKIWRTDTWEEVCSAAADDCDDLTFTSDSRWLAYCDGREAVLMDVDQWQELHRFRGHSITVHGLAFSADDGRLATACEDRKLRVWNRHSGELLQTFSGHPASIQQVVFSPDDRTLVSGDAAGNLKLWSLETGQELFTLASLGIAIDKLAFDPSGGVLLAKTTDGRIHVFAAEQAR